MNAWDKPELAHLTDNEKRAAALWFKVNPETVSGPPTGLIIDEMARPGDLATVSPLFPYPTNSPGGKLMKMSGLSIGDYLGRLFRINLIQQYSEKWDPELAMLRAAWILENTPIDRIVLLGQHVGAAFGFNTFFTHELFSGKNIVCIPHPGGSSAPIYNDNRARIGAAATIKFAADKMDTPAPKPRGRMR